MKYDRAIADKLKADFDKRKILYSFFWVYQDKNIWLSAILRLFKPSANLGLAEPIMSRNSLAAPSMSPIFSFARFIWSAAIIAS